jgi:hypothetical protein
VRLGRERENELVKKTPRQGEAGVSMARVMGRETMTMMLEMLELGWSGPPRLGSR